MNIKEVKDLIHEVLQSDISEFELEHTGTRVRLKRGFGRDTAIPAPIPSQSLTTSIPIPPASVQRQAAQTADNAEDSEGDVGTYGSGHRSSRARVWAPGTRGFRGYKGGLPDLGKSRHLSVFRGGRH